MRERETDEPDPEGNLAFTAACVASFQSSEAVKVLLGKGDAVRNRLLAIDLLWGSCDSLGLG